MIFSDSKLCWEFHKPVFIYNVPMKYITFKISKVMSNAKNLKSVQIQKKTINFQICHISCTKFNWGAKYVLYILN